MLGAPVEAVVGCGEPDRTAAFLGALGFTEATGGTVPRAAAEVLYGIDADLPARTLRAPGAPERSVRLVRTPHPALGRRPADLGGYALDVYTRDTAASVAAAGAVGATATVTASYPLGPAAFAETRLRGPDGLDVVVIETAARRPSLLDHDADRLHSEPQAFVFLVGDVAADRGFWDGPAGLDVLRRERWTADESLRRMMELPEEPGELGLDLYWLERLGSARIELLDLTALDGTPATSVRPLRPGLAAIGFTVADPAAAMAPLAAAGAEVAGPVPVGDRLVVSGRSPAGVPFELWSAC